MRDGLTMGKKLKIFVATTRAFVRAKGGNVAMIFAISVLPFMIAAGTGLDFARAMLVRQQMGSALDAAALAVGSTTGLDQASAQLLARKYFAANYTVNTTDYGTPTVTIPLNGGFDSKGSVVITATTSMPTVLMKLVNITALPITISSNVVWGQTKLWVALVLDNSGSMSKGDSTGSKMDALHNASHQLLTILHNAAANDGDVKVSIVPFDRIVNVGTTNVSASWIDWTDWEAPPPNVTLSTNDGPGVNCPFTTSSNQLKSPYGYYCVSSSSNGASKVSSIPSSGMICPGIDDGDHGNSSHRDRYYNGCWDSVIAQTQTVTSTNTTPITTKQDCSQKGSGTITCTNQSNYPKNGTTTNNTTTVVTSGYSGNSTSNNSNTVTNSTVDGSKSCDNNSPKKCTWTRTITQTKTDTAVTKSAYGGYTHTWRVNSHSTWTGCIMDRDKTYDYDVSNTAPSTTATGFPAMNMSGCLTTMVTPLSSNWTALGQEIDDMAPNNSTNQAIGMAHGWQTLSDSSPYSPGAAPSNTTRYIIILSDGLNTQDRWWGDGSTEGTTEDGYIDDRMDKVCDAAKADGVVVYSIFLHIGTNGKSAPLSNCATDPTKYFDLTSTSAVVTTFQQIAQQITNVRMVK